MSDTLYAIIIPVAIVVVVLKVTLICCRIWLYQKRREQRLAIIRQRNTCAATARVVSVRQIKGPGGIAQQTNYAIQQPGCPPQHLNRTVIVPPGSRHPNDPNLPPSYNQAVSGTDKSVKVQEGNNEPLENDPLQQPIPQLCLPSSSQGASNLPPPDTVTNTALPHMPPPANPSTAPPAYDSTPSAPSPDITND